MPIIKSAGVLHSVSELKGAVEAGNRVAPLQQWSRRSDLQKGVVEEQADGLRLLIVVGGHGAFVPRFAIARRSSSLTSIVNLRSPRRRRSRTARIRSAEVATFCPSVASMVHGNSL